MAETKKTAAAKPVAKAADAKKEEKKTETVAAVKEAPKAEEKKPAVKKEAAKKPVEKKAAEKKPAEKKTAAKAPAKQEKDTAVVHLQFAGKSYTTEDLVKSAKDVWQYDLNRKPEDFKTVNLYVKPEENLAYYVINGDVEGSFFI